VLKALGKLSKILGILLISILLIPFVVGATFEVAPEYAGIILPIILLFFVALAIGLYYNSRRDKV